LPNRATAVETSPTSHVVTFPSFLSPPPPISTTTTRVAAAAVAHPSHCPFLGRVAGPTVPQQRGQQCHVTGPNNAAAMSLPNYARPRRRPFPIAPPRQHPATRPNDAHRPPRHTVQVGAHSRHVTAAAGVPTATTSPLKGSSRRAGRRGRTVGARREEEGKGDDVRVVPWTSCQQRRRREGRGRRGREMMMTTCSSSSFPRVFVNDEGIPGAGDNNVLRRYPPAFLTPTVGWDGAYAPLLSTLPSFPRR